MSSNAVIEQDSATPSSGRTGTLSAVALGYLCLVPVALVVLAQLMQVGFGMTLASTVPISDSNVWSGCASALSHISTPEYLDWCLKRPSQMFLQAPLFLASPNSMGAAIVLQTLVLCGLLWWLLCTLRSILPLSRLAVWITYLAAVWPITLYGTQLGTESPALALSLISATAFLKLLGSRRLSWGFVSGATALLAFQMRPGNVFLTVAIAIGVVSLAWRMSRRWLQPLGLLVGFFLVWWLPDQLLRMAGWSEAGHSSNFWSVLYSAASPANDTWEAAYVRFAKQVGCTTNWNPDPCMGLESFRFADLLRDSSLQLIRDNPLAIPRQAVTNLTSMFDISFLNQMWVNPFPPAWKASQIPDAWHGSSAVGVLAATALWFISWTLLAAVIVAIVRLRRSPSWKSSRVQLFGASALHRMNLTLWLGLVTILGSIAFFAFVGHDEPQRHMVQNIPFVLMTIAVVITVFTRRQHLASVGASDQSSAIVTSDRSRYSAVGLGLLVAVIASTAIVEGHGSGQTLEIVRSCTAAGQTPVQYQVVGKARWNAVTDVHGPSDWRVLQGRSTQSFPAAFSWPQSQVNVLPAGNILSLRTASGDILPVFMSDTLNAKAAASGGSVVWCTQIPSQFNSIIVHDLEIHSPAALATKQ